MNARFKNIGTFSALLLTGTLMNPSSAEARPPRARELCGLVQAIDLQSRTLTIQSPQRGQSATFVFKSDARFIKDWKFADADSFKQGFRACVYYRSPLFGRPFVTKVVWTSQQNPG